jgi:uncharacterized protein YjdB
MIPRIAFAGLLLLLISACSNSSPTPPPTRVVSVTVTPDLYTLAIGGTVQLEADVRDSNGEEVLTTPIWTSSDTMVATCSENGLVTGVAEGSATITARVETETGTAEITVEDAGL